MKKYLTLTLLFIFLLVFSCNDGSGTSNANLEEIKALAEKLPNSIDLDPVESSASGSWRSIDEMGDGDYSFKNLAQDLYIGMSMASSAMKYTKTSIADSQESKEGNIQNLNAPLTLEGVDASLYELTLKTLKYEIVSGKLVLWLAVYISFDDGGSGVELDMELKISATETGFDLVLAMNEGIAGSYPHGINRYWKIDQTYSSGDINMFESYKETGLYYTIQNRKYTNSVGKHDFSSIKIEGTTNAGMSGNLLLNRNEAIYGDEFTLESDGTRADPTTCTALIIYNTDGTLVGRIGDGSAASFDYNSHTYTVSDYQNNWGSGYDTAFSDSITNYKAAHNNYQPTIDDDTFFPHSEFDEFGN